MVSAEVTLKPKKPCPRHLLEASLVLFSYSRVNLTPPCVGVCLCFRPRLWSAYRYRTLLVLYVQIHANILFVDVLRRGRLYNCYTRLLGASVGRDADVATSYFTDHDLVREQG